MQEPLRESATFSSELQAKARQMYIEMPVVRVSLIARRFKINGVQIKAWIEDQDWLNARRTFHENEVKSLLKDIDDPRKSAKTILKLSKKVQKHLESQLTERDANQFSISDLNMYSEALNRLQQIQVKAYERMRLR